MNLSLTFAGAAGTVTGSRFVLDAGDARILVDCGLYQGEREIRERNWQPFPVPPDSIDSLVLSHAHIDHSGYLPRLIADGFRGHTYGTAPTKDICRLLLPDSAGLMEEEAEYRNRKGATRFRPALPLYSERQAVEAADRIETMLRRTTQNIGAARLSLTNAGHIAGSSVVHIEAMGRTIVFSGDLGRQDPLLLPPPEPVEAADYLVLESTYGDRAHEPGDPRDFLEETVRRVVQHRGVLVIPAFAVGRTQEVLFLLRELQESRRIPQVPIAVDSPMATDMTSLLIRHGNELNQRVRAAGPRAFRPEGLRFTRTPEESKSLNQKAEAAIIISAAGMATGGRVLHHLRRRLPSPRNMVLFAGYQAPGTRGRELVDGAPTVRIFGEDVPVRSEIVQFDGLSAHADCGEIIAWLRGFSRPPRRTFLVHGEDPARQALAERIRHTLGWDVYVPAFGERVTLA